MKDTLVNCSGCGRDTRRISGLCWRCSHITGYQISEQRGRKWPEIDTNIPHKTRSPDVREDDYSEDSYPPE